jgi:predicted HNH restriction endonuclease
MLDFHHKKGKENNDIGNLVLLCPNHHREVHLGWRKLSTKSQALSKVYRLLLKRIG